MVAEGRRASRPSSTDEGDASTSRSSRRTGAAWATPRRELGLEQVEAMPWLQSVAAVAAQLGRGRRVHLAIVETLERAPS